MKRSFILFWLLLYALPTSAGDTVLGRDGIQSALLSPDGQHIALLNRAGDIDQLLIISVEKKNTAFTRKSSKSKRIDSIAWIDNSTLALNLAKDANYHLEPQRTGEIEILRVSGDSLKIGGANRAKTAVQRTLSGKQLFVSDGLSSIPGVFLVADPVDHKLWRISLDSDSIQPLIYPPISVTRLSVSPNAKYIAAEGSNAAGEARAMVWSDTDDQGWAELDGSPTIVAVSDAGIVFVIVADDSAAAGLVSMAIATGEKNVLVRNASLAVEQIMINGARQPYAARSASGLPSWSYLDRAPRLTALHKSFVAALPDSDVSFVSVSRGNEKIIAKQSNDDQPGTFFLVEAESGHTERLLDSSTGLSIVGGEEKNNYKLQPIQFASKTGSEISGFISLPQEDSAVARPMVVLFRDESDNSRWQWGFDEQTWFFHRQGFNVLMVDGNRTMTPKARVSDVEEAVRWATQERFAHKDRLCFFGRGTGAELAVLTAMRNDKTDCLVSLGGTFGNPDLLMQTAEANKPGKRPGRRLNALLIYGTDDSPERLASQDNLRSTLAPFDSDVETMAVSGERRVFSSRQNEVRAFARISSFLRVNLARKEGWPTLPLIYEQAMAMNGLHEALAARFEEGTFDKKDWRRWFKTNDKDARKLLFDEQLALYDSYQDEIIEMAESSVGANILRFVPIRQKSITH